MAYWLLKTEPETWSWDMQTQRAKRGEPWTGVRNHVAKSNLSKMKVGDRAFFYHSGKAREIVGVVQITRDAYPDPTDITGRFVAVDVEAVGPLEHPVTLEQAKREPQLANMVLVNNTRLSVQPVTSAEWKAICKLGGVSLRG